MRFVVFGAGAVGGVVGGRLHQHGHDVVLVARGPHHAALRDHGLRLESPVDEATLAIPVVDSVDRLRLTAGDVVLLTVKSQDTAAAVRSLSAAAPAGVPVVCVQNGVANERCALRAFPDVYAVPVHCMAAFVRPGVVHAYSAPVTGRLDIGRYPAGDDGRAHEIAAAFRRSTFDAEVRADVQPWKYGKLLGNLGNAIEVVCGPAARRGPIGALARAEGLACYEAAGIAHRTVPDAGAGGAPPQVGGQPRPGGSTWQSVLRRTGTVESDYLNGEIVLLGRLHGVPTPVNALLQRLANEVARGGRAPAATSQAEFLTAAGVGGLDEVAAADRSR